MQRRRGTNAGLLLLFAQIYQFGFNNIPPVTLALLGLNIYLFLNPIKSLLYVCISVHDGYYHRDWERFLFSPFHHTDDWHLYFNMVSLLWKGTKLEQRLGSVSFAVIIAAFSQLIGVVYVLIQFLLAECLHDPSYNTQCAVGFSGVLFALKVLNTHYHPGGSTSILGFHVPNKYACWAELVAIHLLFSGTSFVGHLSGILVGLLYTRGPLQWILNRAGSLFTELNQPRPQRFNNSGYARYPQYEYQRNRSEEPSNMNTGGLNEDEQPQQAVQESLNETGRSGTSQQPTLEELRRRRLNRLNRLKRF